MAWHQGSGLKSIAFCCLLCGFALSAFARVVINEVCYDPLGADTGKEWIELYNAGTVTENLEGARIYKAGSSYELVFEIPYFLLRPGRFLLIGEALVSEAVFIANLAFQNGGSASDAIQYRSPDGTYTDTVIYDSPNLNFLTDDSGNVAVSFAPDVPEGWSLARIVDGYDTDDCALDFIAEANPTPGLSNRPQVDYALLHPSVWQQDEEWLLGVFVKNVSPISSWFTAQLRVLLDGVQVGSNFVDCIAAGDSLYFLNYLPVTDDQNHALELILDFPEDTNPDNNQLSLTLFQQELLPPLLNEIMYYPPTGYQEWIEVFIPVADTRRNGFWIRDAANNNFSFSLPEQSGYFVLCNSAAQLLSFYPQCPPEAVIEVSGWAILNNTGDTIQLLDSEDNILDELSYVGSSAQQGKSLERYLNSSQQVAWRYSLDPSGATPGRINSQPQNLPPEFTGQLKLQGSPCKAKAGESISIFHRLQHPENKVNCRVFSRGGSLVRVLADNLTLPSEGVVHWDGKDSRGKFVPRGLYFIVWESRSSSGGKLQRQQLSAVIYD